MKEYSEEQTKEECTMLEKIRQANPGLLISTVTDPDFQTYGLLVDRYDLTGLRSYIQKETSVPPTGNTYVADLPDVHGLAVFRQLEYEFFGGLPIQIGYSNGHNTQLNALEFHKSSELVVAVTDCILLLARLSDMENRQLASEHIRAFYLHQGQAVELFGPTLHFAPCAVSESGYKTAVVLPRGTNLPLAEKNERDPMLRLTNKWLIAHPDCERLVNSGAWVGITGDNIEIQLPGNS